MALLDFEKGLILNTFFFASKVLTTNIDKVVFNIDSFDLQRFFFPQEVARNCCRAKQLSQLLATGDTQKTCAITTTLSFCLAIKTCFIFVSTHLQKQRHQLLFNRHVTLTQKTKFLIWTRNFYQTFEEANNEMLIFFKSHFTSKGKRKVVLLLSFLFFF